MAKISVGLAMTLKLSSGGGFNMFKPEISVSDIDLDDPDVSPDEQLKAAIDYIGTVYGQVEGKMSEIIENSEIEEKRETVTELSKASQELSVRLRKLELSGTEKGSVSASKKDNAW